MQKFLNLAIELAYYAHLSQQDKAGKPYILHPIRVMNAVEKIDEKIVAILHDTLEDTTLKFHDLWRLQFPIEILNAMDAISKYENEPYKQYIERVCSNKLALKVKIADMEDNMDMSRIPNPTEKDLKRIEKYQKTYPILLGKYNEFISVDE